MGELERIRREAIKAGFCDCDEPVAPHAPVWHENHDEAPTYSELPGWQQERFTQLWQPLKGVPLTADQARILRWLAVWDRDVVDTVASLFEVARRQGGGPAGRG